jgi:5-methylcytosine-specific restriction endonuclease McrA
MDKETVEYIINVLRRGTITWSGRTECLNRGRYKVVIDNKKLWARDCDECGEMHLQKNNDLEVDHIIEIGGFKGDWNDFIPRMYCKQSNLQALCFSCHSEKTSNYNAKLRFVRKSK